MPRDLPPTEIRLAEAIWKVSSFLAVVLLLISTGAGIHARVWVIALICALIGISGVSIMIIITHYFRSADE